MSAAMDSSEYRSGESLNVYWRGIAWYEKGFAVGFADDGKYITIDA